jgi:hypothetical protein
MISQRPAKVNLLSTLALVKFEKQRRICIERRFRQLRYRRRMVIERHRAHLYAVDVMRLAAVVAALDAVIDVKPARGGDFDNQPTLRNRYGVVMAVFLGIL